MRVLVTGGAGFIGGHVSSALLEAGHAVSIIDDLSTGSLHNIPKGAALTECDICSDDVEGTVASISPEAVIHLAAQVSVLDSVKDPARDRKVNVDGSARILGLAVRSGCRCFVNVSTGIVYGDPDSPDDFPLAESQMKKLPFPYSRSKFEFERILFEAASRGEVSALTLRPGNVYGPRQDPHGEAGVVAIFSGRLLSGEPLNIHGEGTATRDYVYVADAVDAILKALDFLADSPLKSASSLDDIAFNIGNGVGTSVLEIAGVLEGLAAEAGLEVSPRTHGPPRPDEVSHIRLDCSKARTRLGWEPRVVLIDGLSETFRWFSNQRML